MTTLIHRLTGHISWHFRRVQKLCRAAQVDPALLKLAVRNRLSSAPIVAPNGPIVSLTSYGSRIDSVFFAIESIGMGTVRPAQIILWLDDKHALANPPTSLSRLAKRGLQILPTENYLSHKKYLPYVLSKHNFEHPLVTADDDVLYPKTWLANLLNAYNENCGVINCYRARNIKVEKGQLSSFTNWRFCSSTQPSFNHFSEGVAGVIFPPRYLNALKKAGFGFKETCPMHDDVWLNVIALRNGFRVRQIGTEAAAFPLIPNTQENGLWVTNLGPDGDRQIHQTYTQADVAIIESETLAELSARSS